jgi:hypothetical protein
MPRKTPVIYAPDACAKKHYKTRKQAEQRIKELNTEKGRTKGNEISLRPVRCSVCSYWHLQ